MEPLHTLKDLLASILLSCLIISPCFASQQWTARQDESTITFTASYDEIAFNGDFSRFSSTIAFDAEDFASSQIESTIDITSINTNSSDRDQALAEADWFYFSRYPQATFISQQISRLDNENFIVSGLLQIRDQQKQISFPLQWQKIDANTAHLNASFELDRRDFNIGTGEWAEDETIGFAVSVSISLIYRAI